MSIGDRLKEEISRLRLNQTDMAAAGEVEEFTQEIFAEKRPVYDFALVFFRQLYCATKQRRTALSFIDFTIK